MSCELLVCVCLPHGGLASRPAHPAAHQRPQHDDSCRLPTPRPERSPSAMDVRKSSAAHQRVAPVVAALVVSSLNERGSNGSSPPSQRHEVAGCGSTWSVLGWPRMQEEMLQDVVFIASIPLCWSALLCSDQGRRLQQRRVDALGWFCASVVSVLAAAT